MAHSCLGLGSFVGVDVFVVGIVPMVMGMELHVWRKTPVPLAVANSLDAGRKVVMETSFVVDIAPMEGAMAGIARSSSQTFGAEKRHRPETEQRQRPEREQRHRPETQTRDTDQRHRPVTQTRDTDQRHLLHKVDWLLEVEVLMEHDIWTFLHDAAFA